MICNECGKEIDNNVNVCPYCGCPVCANNEINTETCQFKDKIGLSVSSMVLGILSLLLMCIGIGYVLAIIGIILGIVSLSHGYGGKGMSIAGVTTSAVTLFLLVVGIIGIITY